MFAQETGKDRLQVHRYYIMASGFFRSGVISWSLLSIKPTGFTQLTRLLLCRPLTYSTSSIYITRTSVLASRHSCCMLLSHRHGSNISRTVKRYEKLGIGPDGKPLPTPNNKKIHPKMYKVLMVNQDGSSYTIRHRYPHKIIKLPLDLSTLTPEQLAAREKKKQLSKARVYVEEEGLDEDDWDQDRYRNLT